VYPKKASIINTLPIAFIVIIKTITNSSTLLL
jgi:hypothetical protein